MPKLNRGFQSGLSYFVMSIINRIFDASLKPATIAVMMGRAGYSRAYGIKEKSFEVVEVALGGFVSSRPIEYEDNQTYFNYLGILQPLVNILKDVVDTIKPYKSWYHFRRDLLQPLAGLGSILSTLSIVFGVGTILAEGLFHFFLNLRKLNFANAFLGTPLFFIESVFTKIVPWVLESALTAIRGVAQILTTPLTWFIRMPLRAAITYCKGGMQEIEQNKGIRESIAQAETILRNPLQEEGDKQRLNAVLLRLHLKFEKSIDRKQSTEIDSSVELSAYEEIHKPASSGFQEKASQYLSLFSKKMPAVSDAKQPASRVTKHNI